MGGGPWQVLLFLFLACAGLYHTLQVPVGLDQELAMPKVGGWRRGCPTAGRRGAGAPHSATYGMRGVLWLL